MAVHIPVKQGVPYHMDADDQRTFERWMAAVDAYLRKYIGLSAADLPDCRYRDWYEERVRPIRAANKALKAAGADLFC